MSAALAQSYDSFYADAFGQHHDPIFDQAAAAVSERFKYVLEGFGGHLFLIDLGGFDLFETYLQSFPAIDRQYHNCNTCKTFIRKFGRLAAVDHEGKLVSAMWAVTDKVPRLYRDAFSAMQAVVESGKIDSVFLSSQEEWGEYEKGGFTHFAVTPPPSIRVSKRGTMSAGQLSAKRTQDFGTLSHGLADYPKDIVAQAVNLLQADALYRAEKVLAPAKFLLELHQALETVGRNQNRRKNLVWRAVAGAHVGFAQPRSTMLGTLLDDIKSGKPVDVVAKGFASKMSPLQYQRPTAAPTAGNILQAEKLVAEMGIANSLRRRFARLEDIEALWLSKPIKDDAPVTLSVFAGLMPKNSGPKSPDLEAPVQVITFEKFRRTVLPNALKIEAYIEPTVSGIALLTAADMDAPPIIQWDREDRRNPVSWYVYPRGDSAGRWNLTTYSWAEVKAVTLQPSMWSDETAFAHQGQSAILVIAGCRDTTPSGGNGLFPEILKSELHQVRATIEAHARRTPAEDKELATACGIRVAGKGSNPQLVRVTTALGKARYRIDRWD